tara:strand:+ start:801 stop:1235 length:435 start_codon:yes stop_codon:yes gene_type:complete
MADVALTTVNLVSGSTDTGTASVAVTAGQLVGKYLDTDNNLGPCIATDAHKFIPVGIALNNATVGDIVVYAKRGAKIDSPQWANTDWGTQWWVSNTSGQVCNYSDLDNGDNMFKIGYMFEYNDRCILDFTNMLAVKSASLPSPP